MENVPVDENVWKVVLRYSFSYLTLEDKLSLRLVCRESNNAVKTHVYLSQNQIDNFFEDLERGSYNYDSTLELESWLKMEKKIESLIELNDTDETFRDMLSIWLSSMYDVNVNVYQHLIDSVQKSQVSKEYSAKKLKPSFRRSVKKIVKGVSFIGTAAGTIVSLPLAALSIPLMPFDRGSNSNPILKGLLYGCIIPLLVCGNASINLYQEASAPNLRLSKKYNERLLICECIKRIITICDNKDL